MTKFESQSFKLRSKYGVAFAQRKSRWHSQRQRARGRTNCDFFPDLVGKLLCRAYATYCTEDKGYSTPSRPPHYEK